MKLKSATTQVPDLADRLTPRDAEGELRNEVRAEFGRAAVDVGTADRGHSDERTDAVDTIANVMHWLHGLEIDPDGVLHSAASHFKAEVETVEKRAVRILTEAGLDARLHHSGGGIWVAEVRSRDLPGRQVWVTDSEDREGGPFLVGVYPASGAEGWFEDLSGPCPEEQLVAMVKRALTEEAG